MIQLNKVIRTLILSDFILQCGWGLFAPIFAIFVTKQIQGGSLEMVGLIVATFWLTKSIAQPFIAHYLDKSQGEKDDLIFLVGGMYVANLTFVGYIFSTQLWHLFTLDFIRGLAMACVIPSWAAIFTRHIDRGREAFSWSIESTGIGFAAGFAAAFGAVIASTVGFRVVLVLVSLFGLISSSILLMIRNQIFTKDHFVPRLPPSEKPF